MDFTNQDSDSETFNLKVQHLREDVARLRRQLNQERQTSIERQRLIRARFEESPRYTSSRNVLPGIVSTTELNPNNQCSRGNFLPKSNLQPAREPNASTTYMSSLGQAKPSRLDSKPPPLRMAKLKAPGPYETQVLSEINRAKLVGHRPTPSNMYCAVSRIRKQRAKFFHEQLQNIDNSCMQELKRIELNKCRLTPLLKESSTWHTSASSNSSETYIPETTQNACQSRCWATDVVWPTAGRRLVNYNFFEPISHGSVPNSSSNSSIPNARTQYYDPHRQVLTQSSRMNTIRYSSNLDKFRYEASKCPKQTYSNYAVPELDSHHTSDEDFSGKTFVSDANESNLIGYPSKYQRYEFNPQDNFEKNPSLRFGQSVHPINEDNISERKFVANSSCSRPKPRNGSGLNSTTKFDQDYTKSKCQYSNRNFLVQSSESSSRVYQPSSMCRLSVTKRFNQETSKTVKPKQYSDCSVSNFDNISNLTSTRSRPSLSSRCNKAIPKRFNCDERMESEDQHSPRKFVNTLSCNWLGYQLKTSPCRFPTRPCPAINQNQESTQITPPIPLHRSIQDLAVKPLQPVAIPTFTDFKYCANQNFKHGEHNSAQGQSSKLSPPQCSPNCSSRSEDEIEEEWFKNKSWTVDEILKMDEEVTKSLWNVYNNQVRDLAADILKPFVSESTLAYLKKELPKDEGNAEVM